MSKATDSTLFPQVEVPDGIQKVDDYLFFISLVRDGLWQNNTYMAELCGVDRTTIIDWKKTEPAVHARRGASRDLLKDLKRRGEVKMKLKEAGMELEDELEKQEITVVIRDYGTRNNSPAETA